MNLSPRSFRSHAVTTILAAAASTLAADAMIIRGYQPSIHDWLVNNPGKPALNPSFTPTASLFRGIGSPSADPVEWFRHMALISPRHFVYATHYEINDGWQLQFLGSDGALHGYGIARHVTVFNNQGQPIDLMLGTLAKDVDPATGIKPFPVLNLSGETDYIGKPLVSFGKAGRGTTTSIHGFTTLVNDPGFDTTRFAYFDYQNSKGKDGECNFEGGDSGCPSFIMVDGKPALLGTNSGQDHLGSGKDRNFCNFIPAYMDRLDALMEPEGYHVTRVHPQATTLTAAMAPSPALHRSKGGAVTFTARNSGAAMAHNVCVQLVFSAPPAEVSGPGWICEALSPLAWTCHRGGIPAAGTADISISWKSLSAGQTLRMTETHFFDGSAPVKKEASFPLAE